MIDARAGWWAEYGEQRYRRVEAWTPGGEPMVVDEHAGMLTIATALPGFRRLRATIAAPDFSTPATAEPSEYRQARSMGAALARTGEPRSVVETEFAGDLRRIALQGYDEAVDVGWR